ncbi:MAG: hypothetical protein HKN91_15125 [Acidimicrobiia bacterium]|nr:hypothetical protein [Acidimicrobiia bacterium]
MTSTTARTGLSKQQKRNILWWEVGAFVWIMIAGSAFHFIYELSNFNGVAALFGSVNESTWEHLKLFFWPGLIYAVVQHAFVKDYANNYWWGKALALFVTPFGVIFSFYFYLGIALPFRGSGWLWADISTGAFGVLAGNIVAYRILTAPKREKKLDLRGKAIILAMTAAFLLLTYFPIRMFLFEDFLGYEPRSEYGILEDYSEHLVFTEPDL